jgi:L-serine dehydratase
VKPISILNDVLGPVMRGPSSSHTAGAYHLAALARQLLGEVPVEADIAFDPDGSYVRTYQEQGADRAFAFGLLGWELTDERFPEALRLAKQEGLTIRFVTEKFPEANHPNTVRINLKDKRGSQLTVVGNSIGGGQVEIFLLDGWPVSLTGAAHEIFVEAERAAETDIVGQIRSDGFVQGEPRLEHRDGRVLIGVRRTNSLSESLVDALRQRPDVGQVRQARPLMFLKRGTPPFASAADMVALGKKRSVTTGELGAWYEAQVLGITEEEAVAEIVRRFETMFASVEEGLRGQSSMQLLRSSADKIMAADRADRLPTGGMHTRVAARAMAAMHVNCSMGVVCAAPTAGSAGVLPGVMATLLLERQVTKRVIADALFAAGLVGMILAQRATFAAEEAGCQVEIGAAGAMAAAAIVETADGTAQQAADAAAICFQNTMGTVCDLVQGIVEIPCHTRNAVAASSAFVVADMVLGGYENPIPLDETIDAVYAVGQMMPTGLRCTSLAGLAVTPSALNLKRLR